MKKIVCIAAFLASCVIAFAQTKVDVLANVPEDSTVVISIDYSKLYGASFFEDLKKAAPPGTPVDFSAFDEVSKKLKDANINGDVSRIVVFAKDTRSDAVKAGILLQTSLTEADIEKILKEDIIGKTSDKFKTETIAGKKVFLLKDGIAEITGVPDSMPAGNVAVLQLVPGIVMFAEKDNVAGILNASKGFGKNLDSESTKLNKDVLIFAALQPDVFKVDDGGVAMIPGLESAYVSIDVAEDGSAFSGKIILSAKDADGANAMFLSCQQSFLMLTLMLQSGPEAQELVSQLSSAITFAAKDNKVHITVKLTEALLTKLKNIQQSQVAE